MMNISAVVRILRLAVGSCLFCNCVVAMAQTTPASDVALQQLQLAETVAREAEVEAAKKPPREVRKREHQAEKDVNKDPKRKR